MILTNTLISILYFSFWSLKLTHKIVILDYRLVKSGAECHSTDQNLGRFDNLQECSDACLNKNECTYFIYGTGSKAGRCWWEKTHNHCCSEGWENDEYNFYEVVGRLCQS